MHWLPAQTMMLELPRMSVALAVNWLLQSTLLLAAGLAIGSLMRRRGAALQSLIYRTTLVAALTCPVATKALSMCGMCGWSLEMPPTWSLESKVAAPVSPLVATLPTDSRTMVPVKPDLRLVSRRSSTPSSLVQLAAHDGFDSGFSLDETGAHIGGFSLGRSALENSKSSEIAAPAPLQARLFAFFAVGLALLWAIVSGTMLARLAIAWSRLNRVRRSSRKAESVTIDLCRALSVELGIAPPDVMRTPFLPSPCLAGLRRPAVLLPETGPSLATRDVLTHELAHLLRHDCHWNLLRKLSTAVFFFQPLLWRLSRNLELAAEEVCDDFVVQYGCDRAEYANRLLDVAELSTVPMAPAGVAIVSLRSMLAGRVARIMDTSRCLSTRASRLVAAFALVGGLIGTTAIGFVGAAAQREPSEPASEKNWGQLEFASSPGNSATFDRASKTSDDLFEVSGRVVDPDGRPVAGARIVLVKPVPSAATQTDNEGRFKFPMHKDEFGLNDSGTPWAYVKLMAVAEGYGIDFQAACSFEPTGRLMASNPIAPFPVGNQWDRTLKLAKDDVPVVGTVVDTDGKPVAGAMVRVLSVSIPKAPDLTPWTKAVESGEDYDVTFLGMMDREVGARAGSGALPATVTGSDGTVHLSGIGRDRIARLQITGPGIVSEDFYVCTRPGPKYDVPHLLEGPNQGTFHFFGSTFQYTARRSLPIEGIVRDKASGKPLEGISIRFEPGGGIDMDFDHGAVRTTTDHEGRFVLTGAPIGDNHRVLAIPCGQPYLPATKVVQRGTSQSPAQVEFALTKGIKIEGRVTDALTGAPVTAQLTYFLPWDNPQSRKVVKDHEMAYLMPWQEPFKTDERGNYANVGLAGHGFLAVLVQNSRRYPRAASTPGSAQRHPAWPNICLGASPCACCPVRYNYVADLDIPAGVDTYKFDIVLNPEKQVEGALVDLDGKPLSGAVFGGLTENDGPYFPLPTARFAVASYQPDRPRQVYFIHRDRKLAGSALLKGPQVGTVTVSLGPWASVTGRIVDAQGNPQANALIHGYAPCFGNRPGRAELPERHYRADGSGRFQIDGFVPGLKYDIELIVNGELVHTSATDVELKSGETRDLGDVAIRSK
jgi:beta-lactamase regulating signal transducer with metallopeptidase domain